MFFSSSFLAISQFHYDPHVDLPRHWCRWTLDPGVICTQCNEKPVWAMIIVCLWISVKGGGPFGEILIVGWCTAFWFKLFDSLETPTKSNLHSNSKHRDSNWELRSTLRIFLNVEHGNARSHDGVWLSDKYDPNDPPWILKKTNPTKTHFVGHLAYHNSQLAFLTFFSWHHHTSPIFLSIGLPSNFSRYPSRSSQLQKARLQVQFRSFSSQVQPRGFGSSSTLLVICCSETPQSIVSLPLPLTPVPSPNPSVHPSLYSSSCSYLVLFVSTFGHTFSVPHVLPVLPVRWTSESAIPNPTSQVLGFGFLGVPYPT